MHGPGPAWALRASLRRPHLKTQAEAPFVPTEGVALLPIPYYGLVEMQGADQPRVRSVYTGHPWEAEAAYCRAKRIGEAIVVSGTVAVGSEGEVIGPGDVYLQTQACLERIRKALQQLGADLRHVVRTRSYVTDITRFDAFARAHREAFDGIDPAATCVEVTRLVHPALLVEIEVDAIAPERALPSTGSRKLPAR